MALTQHIGVVFLLDPIEGIVEGFTLSHANRPENVWQDFFEMP